MNTTAMILTCYNRKSITINCLSKLFSLKQDVDVYLVDDNSTDGTSAAIANQFPEVNIIDGNGNLFWNRGMHLAWEKASKKEYDYYIWLNDDVILYDNCFTELFDCLKIAKEQAIISGVIEAHDKSRILYGGYDINKKLIMPKGEIRPIYFLNGNVVLVPKSVFMVLGNLDPVFHHDLGDIDYGLRAIKKDIKVFSTRKPIGSGEFNNITRVRLSGSSIKKRFIRLYSQLGSNPRTTFYFNKKHYGYFKASSFYIFILILNILPDLVVKLVFKNKYS
jgi:GT2 family glycosyltransferase